MHAAADRRRAVGDRGGGGRLPPARWPGPGAACRAGGVRRHGGRAQLARRLLAVPVPGPPGPDRPQRQLLLPVQGLRPDAGGAGGRARRRGPQLQAAARSGADPTGGAARSTSVDGAEQVPVLQHAYPRRAAGHRPRPPHRGVAGPVRGAARRGVLPGRHVPAGRAGSGGRPAQPGRHRGGAARRDEGRPGRRGHLGGPPHHHGPRGVGGRPGVPSRLPPPQRRSPRRRRDRAVLRRPGGLRPRGRPGRL